MYTDLTVVVLAVTQSGFSKKYESDKPGIPDLSDISNKTIKFFTASPVDDNDETLFINIGLTSA